MHNGHRITGYAMVREQQVLEAMVSLLGISAQETELIVLTRAFRLLKRKKVNIYTDSKYASVILYAHGAISKEREILTAENKDIKCALKILALI